MDEAGERTDARNSRRSTSSFLRVIPLAFLLCGCPAPPPAIPDLSINGMCVLLADVWALNAITVNNKEYVSQRDSTGPAHFGFGDFRLIGGPAGDPTLTIVNTDGLPSVYAVSETWFRGQQNEAIRGEVTPSLARDANGNLLQGEPGTGINATWQVAEQDATGSWKNSVMAPEGRRGTTASNGIVGPTDSATVEGLPQWMDTGDASEHLFFCAGTLSANGRASTTGLYEFTPKGLSPGGTPMPANIAFVQDILNGDTQFTPDTMPLPLMPGLRVAPPVPTNAGPAGNFITSGVVNCAMTQLGDDVTTRALHVMAVSGRWLLHATLANYGPVTQLLSDGTTKTFSRFRTVSPWEEITQIFPATDFGDLQHVSAIGTGHDGLLQVFFVGKTSMGGRDMYRIWHTTRYANLSWGTPVDVLAASGDSATGAVFDMPVTASFCPAAGQPLSNDRDDEILLTHYDQLPDLITVQIVARTAKVWVPGRASSNYSQMISVPKTGIAAGFRSPSHTDRLATVFRYTLMGQL